MKPEIDFKKINFINVIGTSGSGKTTFSRKLSEILNIAHIEMDKLFWKPNWTMPDDDEFFLKLKNELDAGKWILDGNYKRTTSIKWQTTEVVIWLDYGFCRTFFQSFKRSINRSITKKELWEDTGNRESFTRTFFDKESILLWVIKTHRKSRKKYELAMSDKKYSGIKFIRLKSPADAEQFLKNLKDLFS